MTAARRWLLTIFVVLVCAPAAASEKLRPPVEPGPFRPVELVEIRTIDPSIDLDIRYATTNNFMGRVLYPEARAFLQRPAAEALARVDTALRRQGRSLVVFDGYRPWSVTLAMWEQATPEWRAGGYVADPRQGSRHNRGCAVDVSMRDLATGALVPMPTGYDDFTEKAHADSAAGTDLERRNRDLLIRSMQAEGFDVLDQEWWHFDYRGWREYPILDLPFSALGGKTTAPPHGVAPGRAFPAPRSAAPRSGATCD